MSDTNANPVKSYSTQGVKTATVSVTDSVGATYTSPECYATVEPTIDTLAAQCSANVTSVQTGQSMTWQSVVTGGTGPYTYSWSGSDTLSGDTSSVSKTYPTTGTKNASVIVSDSVGATTTSNTCSVSVTDVPVIQPLIASCSSNAPSASINEQVLWQGSVNGGTGPYTYSWSGSDSLSGTAANTIKSYSTQGVKTATVVVTDSTGSSTISSACLVTVSSTTAPLVGNCSVAPATASSGQTVTWTGSASGGVAPYTYTWYGAVNGDGQTKTSSYTTAGERSAHIAITDAAGSIYTTNTCGTQVCPGGTCTISDPVPTVSCTVDPSMVDLNEQVTWQAQPSGGTGPYTYTWYGAVSGSGQTKTASFSTTGTRGAHVVVTDANGMQGTSETCQVRVKNDSCTATADCDGTMTCSPSGRCVGSNGVNASCSVSKVRVVVGESVTWRGLASGGDAPYTYIWRGDVSGTSQNESETYTTVGQKYGYLTAADSDDDQDSSLQCSVLVCENTDCGGFVDPCPTGTCNIILLNQRVFPGIADATTGLCNVYFDVQSTEPYSCTFGGSSVANEADNSYVKTMSAGQKTVSCAHSITAESVSHTFTCSPNPAFNQF